MVLRPHLALPLAGLLTAATVPASAAPTVPPPPPTRAEAVVESLHGVEVPDPYRWLEERQSPETDAWIAAQHGHCLSVVRGLPERDRILRRLNELLRVEDVTAPTERGGRYFFTRRGRDQEQGALVVREGLDGPERVLVDPNTMSEDGSTSVRLLDVDAAGSLVAYALRQGGADEITVRFLDLATGRDLPDELPRGRVSVLLRPDRRGVHVVRHENAVGSRLTYHAFGTDPSQDVAVFGQGLGPGQGLGMGTSDDGRWLLIVVYHGSASLKSDVHVQDLSTGGPVVTVVDDLPARFSGEIAGGRLYLMTNWDAPRGRILAVDPAHPDRAGWREVVPESAATLESFSLVGGLVAARYLEDVQTRIRLYRPDGTFVREVPLPSLGTASSLRGRWDSSEAFFTFGSYDEPGTVERYDVASGERATWARPRVPFRGDRYEVEQVAFASTDGTRVPMFLVHRKGLPRDGRRPTMLTGYGGFNISMTPHFSVRAAAWIERGGLHAVANLRGGGEFGEQWHRAGMLGNKQAVFDDFIAAAEWLIDQGWTRPERLAIVGKSNGGLLVGAALTQRPELFRAVACEYPLLDMVRYHRFLVAPFWVPEYGSSDDPEQFGWLRAYSPYHAVEEGVRYPAVLLTTGDSDTRVDPLHARKMAARLQAVASTDRPVLLHHQTLGGHSSGAAVSSHAEDLADELAFLWWQLGEGGGPQPRRAAGAPDRGWRTAR